MYKKYRTFCWHSISCICPECLSEDHALTEWIKAPPEYAYNAKVIFDDDERVNSVHVSSERT